MHLPELKITANSAGAVYAATGIVAATIVLSRLCKPSPLDAIPTVGSTGWFGRWLRRFDHFTQGTRFMEEGYKKYKPKPFKVADFNRWFVVVSSQEHMEEMRKAPDEVLSSIEASNDQLQARLTLGLEIAENPYHVSVIQSQLTRNIGNCYADIRDEVVVAFDEILDLKDHEWKSIPALTAIQKIVCRVSNRMFVGFPMCRNSEWLKLNVDFTIQVMKGALILRLFPKFIASLVARFVADVPGSTKHALELLGPQVEERLRQLAAYGDDWPEKPNDLLSWLLEDAEGPERSVELLTRRILTINFAAIHTSSNTFCHALFYLAANPQYIQPLREEVESIVEKEGWTKASIGKMRKIDSFIRETQRLEGLGYAGLIRKALADYTFADGMFIPKGTFVVAAARSIHREEGLYENANAFNPFRFSSMRDEDGEGTKHQMVATSFDHLPFGHGKHACPGRFFAANELKTMLAHVVVAYDVKAEDENFSPAGIAFGAANIPNPTAKVMFRKRLD